MLTFIKQCLIIIFVISEKAEKFTLQHSDKIQPRCECNKNMSFFFFGKELYIHMQHSYRDIFYYE